MKRIPPLLLPAIALLGCTTNTTTLSPAGTSKSAPVGCMYLVQSDTVEVPLSPDKLEKIPAWTNPHIKGVVIRSSWDRAEPFEGQYYWDFLDKGVALAQQHGLKVSIMVTAGVDTPAWVCDADPTACFLITDTNGNRVNTNVPWNHTFQNKWSTFVTQLGSRFDSQIVHVGVAGYMRRAEGFFVISAEEQAEVEVLARNAGFPDAHTAWLTAAKWILDLYETQFTHAFSNCVLGAPWPNDAGGSMQALVNYGATTYGGKFGAASHGLTEKRPRNDSLAMNLPRTINIGFQFASTQGDNVTGMGIAFDRAINAGAAWVEVYAGDCANPKQAVNLDKANTQMLK